MLTVAQLAAWIAALPLLADGHGHPIPRPDWVAPLVAEVVLTEAHPYDDPYELAATLDVVAAHESAYHPGAIGDRGRSCGLGQTPCRRTPRDPRGQLALALQLLANDCPDPLWLYASGRCATSYAARAMRAAVVARLALAPAPVALAAP